MPETKVRTACAKTCHKIVKRIEGEFHRIYREALAQQQPHAWILERTARLYEGDYLRLRISDKDFLYGVSSTLFRLHWNHLVFSYVVNGKRHAIDSPEYKAVEPQFISEFCSDSGAHMYRGSEGRLFNEPKAI